jgi:hypothetical protein
VGRIVKRRNLVLAVTLPALAAVGIVGAPRVFRLFSARRAPPDLELTCTPGEATTYAFSYESHGKLLDAAFGVPVPNAGGQQSVDVRVGGQWVETCVKAESEVMSLLVTFDDVDGAVSASETGTQPASTLLAGRTFVDMGHDGSVRTIRFDPNMPAIGQNLVRDFLSLRSARLERSPGGSWRSHEEDLNGRYDADYEVTASSARGATVKKTRTDYAQSASGLRGEKRPLAHIAGPSGAVLEIDRSSRSVTSVASNVDVEILVGKRVVTKTESSLSLRRTGVEPGVALTKTDFEDAPSGMTGDLAATDVDARIEERMQKDELGDDTWETLLARAPAADDSVKTSLKWRALFRLHPEECEKAKRVIVRTASDEPQFRMLTQALAKAGTREAQRALTAAMDETKERAGAGEQIMAQIAQITTPTRETEAFVREVALHSEDDDVRGMAKLALGAMSRALRDEDPARAEALAQETAARWSAAANDGERLETLAAIGNAGTEYALDPAREALGNADSRVRGAAAAALRFVEGASAEGLLDAVVEKDPSPEVRAEAVQAMGYRTLSQASIDNLVALARRESSESVRLNVISVLAGEADRFPDAGAALARMQAEDPSASIRQAARMAVLRLQAEGI